MVNAGEQVVDCFLSVVVEDNAVLCEDNCISALFAVSNLSCISDGDFVLGAGEHIALLKLYTLPVLENNQAAGALSGLIVLGLGRDCDCLIYACVCRSADSDNGVIGNIVKCVLKSDDIAAVFILR